MADDGSIDIVGAYAYRLVGNYYNSDMFVNLLDQPQIDFSQPWWPGNYTEVATIGSRQFAAQGNIDPSFYDRTYTLVFNKKIAADSKIDNLYDLVNSGKWTIDKMEEVAKQATADLNGDTKFDTNDQYGYLSGVNMVMDAFNNSFELSFAKFDDNGTPQLTGLTEKITDACTRMKEFIRGSGHVFYNPKLQDAEIAKMFQEGKGLLTGMALLDMHTLRSMEVDFGILPYPKWDEAQESYLTYSAGTDAAAAYAIPANADAELGACLLEALAYYGYSDIWPEYFERALKGKNARDNESAEILEMIFDNIYFDFTQIYSYVFGNQKAPSMLMRMTIKDDKDIASAYAADEEIYKSTMEKLLSALK